MERSAGLSCLSVDREELACSLGSYCRQEKEDQEARLPSLKPCLHRTMLPDFDLDLGWPVQVTNDLNSLEQQMLIVFYSFWGTGTGDSAQRVLLVQGFLDTQTVPQS